MAKSSKKDKKKLLLKSYKLLHKTNLHKSHLLFDLYEVYKKEYFIHTYKYWSLYLNNKIYTVNTRFDQLQKFDFSHLGSTKHISTQLNACYLQICLNSSSSTLNKHLSSIEQKFNLLLNKSSLNVDSNKDFLHQLRTINTNHAWCKKYAVYYPEKFTYITDDYGNLIEIKQKIQTFISVETLKFAKRLFKYIVSKRVKFPNLNKPRLILDSRVCEIQDNISSKSFYYWLKISTLEQRKPILIPVKHNDYFNKSYGLLGNTVEIIFNTFGYEKIKFKSDKLNGSKGSKSKKHNAVKVKQDFELTFNKKSFVEELKIWKDIDENLVKNSTLDVSFDIGLSTLLASNLGESLGLKWLEKLQEYDSKITELSRQRQKLGLKTSCPKYDNLIQRVRGFIKTQVNRILNSYFEKNKTKGIYFRNVNIEKLYFNNPNLSKKLNRIIKNFGLKIIKDKLDSLSKIYGFKVIDINPAYSSQECKSCGYVDEKNRKQQKMFKCLCCKKELNADVHAAQNIQGRSLDEHFDYKLCHKQSVLVELKARFLQRVPTLLSKGIVSRRSLIKLLKDNKYFNNDKNNFICTTEVTW